MTRTCPAVLAALLACSSGGVAAVEVRLVERVDGSDTEIRCETVTQQCPGRGPVATTQAPPGLSADRFVGWTFTSFASSPCQGTPPAQPIANRDVLGILSNPVYFTILENICAEATYVPASADTDADGLPDWFELTYYTPVTQANAASDVELPIGASAAFDGISLDQEYQMGLHPRLRETAAAGGISLGSSGIEALLFETDITTYTESSVPEGIHSARQLYPLGANVTTAASVQPGGLEFAYWTIGNIEQRDLLGRAIDPATAVANASIEAVAYYLPVAGDSDTDGLPDWFEQRFLGTLDLAAPDDGDGDGVSLSREFHIGLQPQVRESTSPGGRSKAFAPAAQVAFDPFFLYTVHSSPTELIPAVTTGVIVGSSITSPVPGDLGGFRFGVWLLDGTTPVRDVLGQARNPVVLTATANVDLLALFFAIGADSDGDGLEDWYETRLSDADVAPAADTDGDGLTVQSEFDLGLSPFIDEVHASGGVSRWESRPQVLDFRAYPRVREVLVSGLPDAFFATTPDAIGAATAGFRLDADTVSALGDWDGDGDLDLFVSGTLGGVRTLRVYRNGGSSVVLDLERETALESALLAAVAGIARPALSLGDVDGDGRADLAVGGSTGTVTVYKSPGTFSGAPTTLSTIATGETSAIPGFVDLDGGGPELVVMRPDGTARAYAHSGNNASPYSAATFLGGNPLPAVVLQATSVSVADIGEDAIPDVVVADAAGRLWEFRRAGNAFQLDSAVFAGTFAGFANRLAASVGDLDGDGDADVIAGFAEGGLVYLRNQVPKLTIDPTVKTLVAGQSIDFALRDPGGSQSPIAPITWRFVSNRSGGTLNPNSGAYSSGNQSRRVDIIEAEDARGVAGRTYVNVIDAADQTQVGKALIVAGGLGTSDAVWGATRTSANRMYRALLQRGYRQENIRYLSLAYGEALDTAQRQAENDLDGNGIANDELYGLPLRATLQESLTSWAAGAADLFVVMIDHGVGGQFTLSGPEKVTASELDAWLDAQQAMGSSTTLVLDYCFSGSFLDALKQAPAERIVLASSTSSQPSYLFDGGEVSFSQSVARGVFQGFDLEQTFAQAEETMAEVGSPGTELEFAL